MMPNTTPQLPPPSRPQGRGGEWVLDLITAIFLIGSVAMVSATILIINNPSVGLNPFPHAVLPTVFQTPTPTVTFTPSATPTVTVTPFPPTPTPTITLTPTVTDTPEPTPTPTLVIAGIETVPTLQPVPTLEPVIQPTIGITSAFPFIARPVRYESNTNPQGCQWMSIAGNATGLGGEPLTDLAVQILGDDFEYIEFTGSNTAFGISGFEVQIASTPRRDNFEVQLLGPTGLPASDFIAVATGDNCETNVAIVEFVQVRD